MLKFSVVVFMLGVSAMSANANAFHLNPDQRATTSMATFGSTTIPIGYSEYCQRYAERCERTAQGSSVNLTPNRWKQLVSVNSEVNTSIIPRTDPEIFGVEERWVYPDGVGDCEDYALEKRKRLSGAGLPPGNLLLTVVRKPDGEGHAVLTVRTDNGDFVLDNLDDRVRLWRSTDYKYLKRQDTKHAGRWVTIRVGQEPLVGAVD